MPASIAKSKNTTVIQHSVCPVNERFYVGRSEQTVSEKKEKEISFLADLTALSRMNITGWVFGVQ